MQTTLVLISIIDLFFKEMWKYYRQNTDQHIEKNNNIGTLTTKKQQQKTFVQTRLNSDEGFRKLSFLYIFVIKQLNCLMN